MTRGPDPAPRPTRVRDVVAAGLVPGWDHRLERKLFGSADPDHIADVVTAAVFDLTGGTIASGIAYHASVSATIGVELVSGERIAIKFVRPDRRDPWNAAITVQRAVHDAGLPVPEPMLGPVGLGNAVIMIDTWLDPGMPDDPAAPATRRALASALHDLFATTRPLVGTVDLITPLTTAPGSDYGAPHDLRFDFDASDAGAEWIDQLNTEARALLATEPADTIGHVDWRGGNVVVVEGELAAIYDWDSAAVGSEPMFVGMAAPVWSLAWEWGDVVHPDLDAIDAFVSDYELARGQPFTGHERSVVRAAQISLLAYTARCEHSDRELGVIAGPDRPFADQLRAVAAR